VKQREEADAIAALEAAENERVKAADDARRAADKLKADAAEAERRAAAEEAHRIAQAQKEAEEQDELIEREIQRQVEEQRLKEELALKAVEDAKRAAEEKKAADEKQKQARIEAAVQERLRKAREESEAKKRAADAEAEIERRVAEALAAENKARDEEAAAAKHAALEAEIERRVQAAAEARVQAALQEAATATAAAEAATKAAKARMPVAAEDSESESESSSSSASVVASEGDLTEEDRESSAVDVEVDPADIVNTNGMFGPQFTDDADDTTADLASSPSMSNSPPPPFASGYPKSEEHAWSLASAPELLHFENAMAHEMRSRGLATKDGRRDRVVVQRFATQREVGRCLAPLDPLPKQIDHTSVQLGFFQAGQTVVSYSGNNKSGIALREDASKQKAKTLSRAKFFFEADILKDPKLTADEDDEDELAHNANDECIVPIESLRAADGSTAVHAGTEAYAFGDPIQVYERARGRRFDLVRPAPQTTPGPLPPPVYTTTSGPTSGKLWVQDIETKKPVPSVPAFTGGMLLRFDVRHIKSQVDTLHGDGTDPLFFSAAVYCIHSIQQVAVTDTFYFDSHGFTFLPHRQPSQRTTNQTSFVAFIPNEFKTVPLYLCVRAFRLASDDFDNYVDMYMRPDKYKQHHVVPMKQEVQQLAMMSELQEELGWVFFPINDSGKLVDNSMKCDKLFRGAKTTNDQEMMKLVMDTRVRTALKTFQMEIEIGLKDVTTNETSFPSRESHRQNPSENESMLDLLDVDVPNAKRERVTFVPCCLPILNAGHFHGYHNVMYLRMQQLRFINLSSVKYPSSTHCNFVVQVCIKASDDDLSEEGIPAIYRKWMGEEVLQTSAFTSTTHGAKEFELADEFKIQLPLTLTKTHHIFFTIYAVTFKKPTPTAKEPRMVKIGYACIPILAETNQSLNFKDSFDLTVVSVDHAAVASSGYIEKFPAMVKTNMFNLGTYAMKVGLFGRSSVHASNTIVSEFFKSFPGSIRSAVVDDKVFSTIGDLKLGELDPQLDGHHLHCLSKVAELPLPEIMAFYPLLTGYCLTLVSSPSLSVTTLVRMEALRVLTEFTSKAHGYDVSAKSLQNRRAGTKNPPIPTGCVRTCTVNLLYHYVTNDLLYLSVDGKGTFRVYAAVAEVLLLLLEAAPQNETVSPGNTPKATLHMKLADLGWFFLDLILRSLYLYTAEHRVPARGFAAAPNTSMRKDDIGTIDFTGFFNVLGRLVKQMLSRLVPIGGIMLVQRISMFIRNLAQVCDRGFVLGLMNSTLQYLEEKNTPHNLQIAVRIFVDDDDVLHMLFPTKHSGSPCFLTAILIKYVGPQLLHTSRDVRIAASSILYHLICRVVNSRRVASVDLSRLAKQFVTLLNYLSENWVQYRQISDAKTPGSPVSPVADKRPLLALLLWIVYNCPATDLKQWYTSVDAKVVAGFIFIITDAQGAFRYNMGKDKHLPEQPSLPADVAESIAVWDARYSTLVTMIGCRVASNLLSDIPNTLRSVQQEKALPAVFPYFLLVESLLSFGNSTASLQVSTAVLHHVVVALMPEIISRKGRMSSGVVLLTIRMMSASQLHVRNIAIDTLERITRVYYELTGSLNKLKNHTANALVAVAESKVRDLRLAGKFAERGMNTLIQRAVDHGDAFAILDASASERYIDDKGAHSGDAAVRYAYNIPKQYLSCDAAIQFPAYLTQGAASTVKDRPTFAFEFSTMAKVMLSLFQDVLRLQTDDTMRYKDSKGLAFYDVVHNFLRQNTMKEVFKWLGRLHEAHKINGDHCEAGMTLVLSAAIGYRVTEAFYAIKGADCKGARIPSAAFTHVLWHDYVRVLPELENHLPIENIYTMATDLSVVPDEAPFTVEGQIRLMKEASEYLDKCGYFELSIKAVEVVGKYAAAKGDYKANAVVHNAMATWSNIIATQSSKRESYRYFLVWARMEREVSTAEFALLKKLKKKSNESDSDDDDADHKKSRNSAPVDYLATPIKMIYKQPENTSVNAFRDAAKKFVGVVFQNEALIQVTDEMVGTQPPMDVTGAPTTGKVPKALKAQLKLVNKCLLTVAEVVPVFEAIHPSTKHLDRPHIINRFEHVNRVGPSMVTRSGNTPLKRSQHVSTNLPKTEVDVMRQQLSVNVHFTTRSFPSTTTAIPVRSSEEQLLDAYETAIETMNAELDTMESTQLNITQVLQCLTPMGVVPPGTYYKEVITCMNKNNKVMSTVREVLKLCRDRLTKCESNGEALQKHPETYALVLKGLADIECAMIDFPEPEEVVAAPPSAAAVETDGTS
ncbi:Hypothetical protein, putative, partial [Bodo saltans]